MIATIINFSTNEAAFLGQCLKEALLFSDQILVITCDHFFDGTPEDQQLLNGIYTAHPNIQFIQYPWSKENFYSDYPPQYWHNQSRLIGTAFLQEAITHVLYVDVDEIIEGRRFAKWLKTFPYKNYCAIRLACYWYFREPSLQATQIEDACLFINRKNVTYESLMQKRERVGMLNACTGKTLRFVEKDHPLVHHFSWVRSEEGLLKKVKTWGHRVERDWENLIKKEFSSSFSGTDFVHGYTFKIVESYLELSQYDLSEAKPPNATFLTTHDVHKIDLSLKFGASINFPKGVKYEKMDR